MDSYTSPIDGHVHLRWEEYDQPFAEWAIRDAKAVGLCAMVEQPNTIPYLDSHITLHRRINFIDGIRGNIEHGIAVAITPDRQQREEALKEIEENERVVSGKTFLARSTASGGIEIIEPYEQRNAWKHISNSPRGKNLVWEFHCEDESTFVGKFDPTKPESHAFKQHAGAEVVQFERQLDFAYEFGYSGIMVVKHVSNPETIRIGKDFQRRVKTHFRILYETTWHHMFLNIEEDYPIHGNLVKMNPPLRTKKMQEELLEHVLRGDTHLIGTDHAPHPYEQKVGEPYKSGIPAIAFYPKGIGILRILGMREPEIKRVTVDTGNMVYFNGRLKPKCVGGVDYDPELWNKYGMNVWSRIDGTK